ncbi:Wzz/FepE/Etk N-terminal domain-containing protein [Solibacillus sp. FSL W7-1324]|uniref:Wzz/FepE/Etk N-terminal domain-containing protein n=1 Tax=Solibacillus sp. FSL W7-1324 TaxID=2921701 RepID=UPI0030F9318A
MEETIELKQIINIILKGKWIIAACTIITLLITGIFTWFVMNEEFESSAVVQIASGVQDTGIMSNYIATEFTPTIYTQRIQDTSIMKEGFKNQGYTEFIKGNFSFTNLPETNLIELHYKAPSPEEAQLHLELLMDETKNQMNKSVKETLNQLEQTYLNETNSLSNEIEQLMKKYNNVIISNKLPEVLILQTITSSQFVLNLTQEQTAALSGISGTLQNELLQLKAQIDSKSKEYQNVLAKYQSVKTGLDSFKPDPFIRVITEPTLNEAPTSPSKSFILVVGLVVGILLGLAVAFFNAYWKNSSRI